METRDLSIRNSIWDDIEFFYKWELQPEVHQFFSIPEKQTYESVIRTYIKDGKNKSRKQYTIVSKADNKAIGRIVLAGIEENWKVEVFRIYIGDLDYRKKRIRTTSHGAVT